MRPLTSKTRRVAGHVLRSVIGRERGDVLIGRVLSRGRPILTAAGNLESVPEPNPDVDPAADPAADPAVDPDVEADSLESRVPSDPPRVMSRVRWRMATRLAGQGIELGPGHSPFPVPQSVSVRLVDRWLAGENASLFPELDGESFQEPDIVSNLDVDGLSMVDNDEVDFVIASHILEHLANPVRMLDDIYRVLKPGGVALVLLPDRRFTFDATRNPTKLDHVIDEYRRDVVTVDDDHVVDFLVNVYGSPADTDPHFGVDELELHRRRSIHVHCWTTLEWLEVLVWSMVELDHRWELLDAFESLEWGHGFEFGAVLRKVPGDKRTVEVRRDEFLSSWATFCPQA